MAQDAVLILGNGFDLDLGLPTRYSDFAKSKFWPFKRLMNKTSFDGEKIDTLNDALFRASTDSSWFDIEKTLGDYASFNGTYNSTRASYGEEVQEQAIEDEHYYNNLVDSLKKYLFSIEDTELNRASVAAHVFQALIKSKYFTKIFSFNYTNLYSIAKRLGIESEFKYQHVHGSLTTNIILGIESRMDFYPGYRYMCKEYNLGYETRFIKHCLEDAKDVVFFGHSLSPIDYHYFRSFFSAQSDDNLKFDNRKSITIFTYDKDSHFDICDQLRNMNERKLDNLFGSNAFRIIRTSEGITNIVDDFLAHIEQVSKPRHIMGPSVH